MPMRYQQDLDSHLAHTARDPFALIYGVEASAGPGQYTPLTMSIGKVDSFSDCAALASHSRALHAVAATSLNAFKLCPHQYWWRREA